MFELHITNMDATMGTVPVSWCFDRQTFQSLKKEHGIAELQVVIVVAPIGEKHSDRKETRYIVPLSQMMTYVAFRFPGPNRIYATLAKGSPSFVRKTVLERAWDFTQKKYDLELVTEEGTYAAGALRLGIPPESNLTAPPLDVEVPAECFAKEPPAWEKAWNTWLVADDRFEDQCAYRRRRLFTYTLQPIPFLLFYLVKILGVILTLFLGARDFSIRPLLQPLSSPGRILDQLDNGLIFVLKKPASYRFWPMIFWPPFVTFSTVTTVFGWWGIVGKVAAIALGLILIAVLLFNVKGLWLGFFSWLEDLMLSSSSVEDVDLVCTDEPRKPKKTLLLRYQALKSKVCRPFPG